MTTTTHTSTCAPATRPDLEIELHGHRVCFRLAGDGPLVVLIHGITGRSAQWEPAIDRPRRDHTVLAPDLLGHGESAKPRGDYSLGAYASGIRDLLVALGHDRRDDRRALARRRHRDAVRLPVPRALRAPRARLQRRPRAARSTSLLRAATLPGLRVRAARCSPTPACSRAGEAVGRRARRPRACRPDTDLAEVARGFGSLADAEARSAFIQTLRAVLDPGGQRVSALDRLYLAESVPTLIVWGDARPDHPGRARPRRARARCPAAGWSCSRASATSRSSSDRWSSHACWRLRRRDRARRARHGDDARPAAGRVARLAARFHPSSVIRTAVWVVAMTLGSRIADQRAAGPRLAPALARSGRARGPCAVSTSSVITSWNIASSASEASGRRRSSASRTACRSCSGWPWSSYGFQTRRMKSSTNVLATAVGVLAELGRDLERRLRRDPERGELGARAGEARAQLLVVAVGQRRAGCRASRPCAAAAGGVGAVPALGELLGADDLRLSRPRTEP